MTLTRTLLLLTLGMFLAASTARAETTLETAGVRGGLVVRIGCDDVESLAGLLASDSYLVRGLDTDAATVAAARTQLREKGIYGKVSVDTFDGTRLPYVNNLVNLIVADDLGDVPMGEVMRVLAPRGVAIIGGTKTVKPVPDTISDWTHYLYNPANNAVSTDTQVASPRGVQWIGGPLWGRHHEHMSSVSAMVSAGGRIVYIMDEGSRAAIQLPAKWKLIARDAFNGKILWKKDIPTWYTHLYPLKSGPAILPRRLIAIDDRVYVALGIDQPLVQIDAATGEILRTYEESNKAEEVIYQRDTLFVVSDATPHEKDTFVWNDPVCWTVGNVASNERTWGGSKRSILAIDPASGKVKWALETNISPGTLSANSENVVYFDGRKVVCLDHETGEVVWKSESLTDEPKEYPSYSLPIMVLHQDVALLAPGPLGKGRLIWAFDMKDGKLLWTRPQLVGGHRSPDDMVCRGDLVWTADVARSNRMVGYDVRTGEEKRSFDCDAEGYWFHHRCHRSKATVNYFMPSRTGIEYVDWDAEHWKRNHWVRGACVYGVMPANGLTYVPQHACACYMETKLNGLNALTGSGASQANLDIPEDQRLEKGPAYDLAGLYLENFRADWPTYRHDAERSGNATTTVGTNVKSLWSTDLGGKLSAVTAAAGRVYVAAVDTHTVYALSEDTGDILWSFVAGGRVDSPPTISKGLVYFGSNDGYIYCLRTADGTLVWRYLAARGRERHMAFEQVESLWPVHGSVLVRDGEVIGVAGRSAFLDGGMRLVRLDAKSGELISETIMDNKVPGTDEPLDDRMAGLNMPPGLPDILSCDGKYIYMRSQEFTLDGKRTNIQADSDPTLQIGDNRHLFSAVGFLDDSWLHRTYWLYGGTITSGCNFWFFSGRYAPAGRIICFDDETIYSYGRRPRYYVWTPAIEYRLYAAKKEVSPEMIEHMKANVNEFRKEDGRWIFNRFVPGSVSEANNAAPEVVWSRVKPSIIARAMVLTRGTLFVAGPPDLVDEEEAVTRHWEPEVQQALADQDAALLGKKGAMLWAVSTESGERLHSIQLKSPPTWDGMAAASGKLLLSDMDGTVHCFAPALAP